MGPRSRSISLRAATSGNVFWLAVISFLNDAASEMIYPLLPFFLVTALGAGPAFLGLVEGVAEGTASALKLVGGWLSDRSRRRKPLVGVGYGLAAVVRPLLALATAPLHVLAVRFLDRVGKGVRTAPRDALLAESVDPGLRGRAFGFHRAADHAGAVVGPLIASGILLILPGRYRLVFALTALPGLLSLLVLWRRVREHGPPELPRASGAEASRSSPPEAAGSPLPASLWAYLGIVVVFTLGNASDAFLLLKAERVGVPLAALPLLWSALHVSKSLWSVPGGALADRVGPRPAIGLGWLIYAVVYLGFAFASEPWQIWVLFAVYGLFYGLTEAPERVLVAALAPAQARGRAFGAFHFAVGFAALPASLLFGYLWEGLGAAVAFGVGASLALLAALLLLAWRPGSALAGSRLG